MARPFLTAEWRRLCLLTYEVPASALESRMPPGTELDLYNSNAHVSLVAFDFDKTRVLGVSWPGFRSFPEINLRFYVRYGDRRGVVFIREFVPSSLVALIARQSYNEPYRSAPMESHFECSGGELTVTHSLTTGHEVHELRLSADAAPHEISEDTLEHHVKEHQWGFGTSSQGELITYEVKHPTWRVHRVHDFSLKWDFERVYGSEWDFLNHASPISVVCAEGSKVEVHPRARSVM